MVKNNLLGSKALQNGAIHAEGAVRKPRPLSGEEPRSPNVPNALRAL
jgi:hypothetical protein